MARYSAGISPTARRVTVYVDHAGKWRYAVQAGNWKVIETAEQGFAQKRSVLARIAKRWPDIEVVVDDRVLAPEDW